MTGKKYTFPEIVKEIRSQLGISQQDLANELGISFATVNRWENNQTKPSKLAKNQLKIYCSKMKKAGRLNMAGNCL